MKKKLINNEFLKGSAVFTVTSFVVSVLNYFFNFLVARFLTLSLYGEFMATISYMALFAVPFGAFNVFLIKRIGATDKNEQLGYIKILENWIISNIKKYMFFILLICFILGFFMFKSASLSLPSVVIIFAMSAATMFITMYLSALQAFKNFFQAGLVNLSMSVMKIVGIIIVILFIPNLISVYFVLLMSAMFALFFAKKLVIKDKKSITKTKYKLKSPLVYLIKRSVLVPLLATFGMVGIISVDIMIVKKFFDPSDVGLYAGLILLGKIILYVTVPLTIVAYTFFTGNKSKKDDRRVFFTTSILILIIGVVALIVYYYLPNLVIGIIFGSKFYSISNLVWMSAIFGSVYSILYLFTQYFIAKDNLISLASLLALVIQIIVLLIYHQSFQQIILIEILLMCGLLIVYMLAFIHESFS